MFVTKNTSLICFTFSTASSPIGMSRATYIEAVPPLELLSQWREAMLTFCFCIISLTVEIIPGRSYAVQLSAAPTESPEMVILLSKVISTEFGCLEISCAYS